MTRPVVCMLLLVCSVAVSPAAKNNVCTRFTSYNWKSLSRNCYHHPDVDTVDPELVILNHVPNVEVYNVSTDDGYNLTVHRLPRDSAKGVAWLQHSITCDAIEWIMNGNESLAFLAWEAGYDVWLPSNRGTTLSPFHKTLTRDDLKFWDFSFHEIGVQDFRSLAKFIMKKTRGIKPVFIGHSMASTSSLIYASTFPDEAAQNVEVFINMATPAFFEHVPFYVKAAAPLRNIVRPILNLLRVGGLLQYDSWYTKLFRLITMYWPVNQLTVYGVDVICGWTPQQFDPQIFGLSIPKLSRGFSAKSLFHYAQLIGTKSSFQQYDYGKAKNMKIYGSEKPPKYPLEKIKTPFYFIYTDKDYLATQQDNEALYAKLPKATQNGTHLATGMNHADYFVGKHKKEKIYDHVISYLNQL